MKSSGITEAGLRRSEEASKTTVLGKEDPYFDWLCILVGIDGRSTRRNYGYLARALHRMEFRAKLPIDQNRGMDGLQLRVEFMQLHGEFGSATNRSACTMFEFLIALAKRMNFLMHGNEQNHYTEYYFWILLRNLRLDKLTDDKWGYMNGDFFVEDAVYRVVDRQYNPNGDGGLFPLKNPGADQRGVEIWYQMQNWLSENCDLDMDI